MNFNSSNEDDIYKSLLSKNLALLLKISGFDAIENSHCLNYLNDIYLGILNHFMSTLKDILEDNHIDQVSLSDLRLLLNKMNTINDDNHNVDSTTLQLNDYTNNNHTSIYHENDTQGIEVFKKWTLQNSLFNLEFKNITQNLIVKNLNIFNDPELPQDIPDSINAEEKLDWVTFTYLNNLDDKEQVLFYLKNHKGNNTIVYDSIKENNQEIILNNDKNDILDTIITPDILKPLSVSRKRKANFLEDNNIERQNWNGSYLDKLNELRNKHHEKKIKLSYEES
ncbi:hypothetical protein ACO0R3_000338 [Hanseniaspora guilliermondii]